MDSPKTSQSFDIGILSYAFVKSTKNKWVSWFVAFRFSITYFMQKNVVCTWPSCSKSTLFFFNFILFLYEVSKYFTILSTHHARHWNAPIVATIFFYFLFCVLMKCEQLSIVVEFLLHLGIYLLPMSAFLPVYLFHVLAFPRIPLLVHMISHF